MIRINLLPYQETVKKENLKRQIVIIAGSFVVFLLLLFYLQLSLSSNIGTLEKNIREKNDRLLVLKKKLGDIEVYKKDIRELEQKLGVIKGLEENRLFPVRYLDELALLVPLKDMWVDKFTGTGADLRIEGVARNNIVVAKFMKSLELSNYISSVSLVSTSQKDVSGYSLLQFNLLCVLKKG